MRDADRIAEILQECHDRRARGTHVDPEQVVREHPDLAAELRDRLAALDVLARAFPPDDGASDRVPGTLGDFRILREIDRGGMGVVYEAEQISMERRVALKVLSLGITGTPQAVRRFQQEAKAAGKLHHTNIVPIYGMGKQRGHWFYAMELIEGVPLTRVVADLRAAGRQPTEVTLARLRPTAGSTPGTGTGARSYFVRVAEMFAGVAEALHLAHQEGVVHRDIKPSNLLLDADGTLKIVDFGLARITEEGPPMTVSGDLVGTPAYMSPEQSSGMRAVVNHSTDVYSLGATLYEVLTLRPPFEGGSLQELCSRVATREPAPPRSVNLRVPRDLETIVLKAMEKDPGARYATAQELANDLMRFAANEPVHARRPTLGQRTGKWVRRHAALVAGLAAVLVLAVTGLAISAALLWQEQARTERQRVRAEANLALVMDALDRLYLDEAETTPSLRRGVSRKLLESGLDLYERFAAANRDNAPVRVEIARARMRAALIYRKLGRPKEAARALDAAAATLRELIRSSPDRAFAHLGLGQVLRWQGRIDEAIVEFREAIRAEPDHVAAHINLGAALCDEKREFDEAIREFRRAIELNPDHAPAHENLGVALSNKGLVDEGIASLRQAIRLAPHQALAHSNLGHSLTQKGLLDEAVAECRAAIRLEPDLALAHRNLGDALRDQGSLDAAVAEYREAVRFDPDDAFAHGRLGEALSRKGLWKEASPAYREAIRLDPDNGDTHFNFANALFEMGLLEESITAYRKAIRLKPEFADAHCNLARSLWKKGLRDEALAECRKAILLNPELALAHFNLGIALAHQGLLDDAIAAYREATRLDPDDVIAHLNLGVVLQRKGLPGEASAVFRRGLDAYEEAEALHADPAMANELAWRLVAPGDASACDPGRVVRLARRAVALAPEAGPYWNTLGVALYRAGRHAECMDALQQSMRLRQGGDAYDWFFVAMAERRLGHEGADEWFDRAVAWMKEHRPDDDELKRFRAEAEETLGTDRE